MAGILQREHWRGEPTELGDWFVLDKDGRSARCSLTTHALGWELRLLVETELLQSQVCRSQDEVFSTAEEWTRSLGQDGWR